MAGHGQFETVRGTPDCAQLIDGMLGVDSDRVALEEQRTQMIKEYDQAHAEAAQRRLEVPVQDLVQHPEQIAAVRDLLVTTLFSYEDIARSNGDVIRRVEGILEFYAGHGDELVLLEMTGDPTAVPGSGDIYVGCTDRGGSFIAKDFHLELPVRGAHHLKQTPDWYKHTAGFRIPSHALSETDSRQRAQLVFGNTSVLHGIASCFDADTPDLSHYLTGTFPLRPLEEGAARPYADSYHWVVPLCESLNDSGVVLTGESREMILALIDDHVGFTTDQLNSAASTDGAKYQRLLDGLRVTKGYREERLV